MIDDKSPLPPPGASDEEDATLLQDEAYIDGPIKVDYGTNLRYSILQAIPLRPRLIPLDLVKVYTSTSTAHSLIPAS